MQTMEILTQWVEDSKVQESIDDLGDDIRRVGSLHAKYIQIYFEEKARLIKLKSNQAKLKKLRWEYWDGKLPPETQKQMNWEPQALKLIKAEIPMYMESDEVMEEINMKVDLQIEKVAVIDSIIKTIAQRGYQLKSVLDWEKYKSGGF